MIQKCREIHSLLKRYISFLEEHAKSGPVLGFIIIICLPAGIIGCHYPDITPEKVTSETVIDVKSASGTIKGNNPVDILIFDRRSGRLNTYQRIESPASWKLKASSSEGDMLFTVLSNVRMEEYGWAEIRSRENLGKITVNLEDETRAYPSMSGECTGYSGSTLSLNLTRRSAEIRIREISCDFISNAYSGYTIENPKIYLINVNAETTIIGDSHSTAIRIINAGRLDYGDLGKFKEPGLIYHELSKSIGKNPIYPDIRFICYPNHVITESPGTPATRLVIEGEIMGKRYFWPISINLKDNGIEGNCLYTYDIHITRPGTSDPDIPIELGSGEIIMETEKWKDTEEYGVHF